MEFKIKGFVISAEEKDYLTNLGFKWCSKCKEAKPTVDFGRDKSRKDGLDTNCKICRKDFASYRRTIDPERVKKIRRDSRNKHAEKARKNKREWFKENKDWVREYKRIRYKEDPLYKMQATCRQMVKRMFKSTGIKKCYKTQEVLGYTPLQLKEHIEKQFKEGMTWENYGDWHIDHIVPISSAKNLEEGIELSKLENLQPLWAEENILKSNK